MGKMKASGLLFLLGVLVTAQLVTAQADSGKHSAIVPDQKEELVRPTRTW